MEGLKWIVFKVQAVNLFLMKESINVTSAAWQCFLSPSGMIIHLAEQNLFELSLIYGLFVYVVTAETCSRCASIYKMSVVI